MKSISKLQLQKIIKEELAGLLKENKQQISSPFSRDPSVQKRGVLPAEAYIETMKAKIDRYENDADVIDMILQDMEELFGPDHKKVKKLKSKWLNDDGDMDAYEVLNKIKWEMMTQLMVANQQEYVLHLDYDPNVSYGGANRPPEGIPGLSYVDPESGEVVKLDMPLADAAKVVDDLMYDYGLSYVSTPHKALARWSSPNGGGVYTSLTGDRPNVGTGGNKRKPDPKTYQFLQQFFWDNVDYLPLHSAIDDAKEEIERLGLDAGSNADFFISSTLENLYDAHVD